MVTRRAFLTGGVAAAATGAAVTGWKLFGGVAKRRTVPTIVVSSVADPRYMPMSAKEYVKLFQAYVKILKPIWGVDAEIIYRPAPDLKAGWNFTFVNTFSDPDLEGALAYHEYDPDDPTTLWPYANVQVMDQHIPTPVAATHELAEMLADPGCQMWAGGTPPDTGEPYQTWQSLFALEIADPVEYTPGLKLGETPVSDFVYPAYFEPFTDGPLDHLESITRKFYPGYHGYQIVRNDSTLSEVWNLGAVERIRNFTTQRCARYHHIMRKWRR